MGETQRAVDVRRKEHSAAIRLGQANKSTRKLKAEAQPRLLSEGFIDANKARGRGILRTYIKLKKKGDFYQLATDLF